MEWTVRLYEPARQWVYDVAGSDPEAAERIQAAIDLLIDGPPGDRKITVRCAGRMCRLLDPLRPAKRDPRRVHIWYRNDPHQQIIFVLDGSLNGPHRSKKWEFTYEIVDDNRPIRKEHAGRGAATLVALAAQILPTNDRSRYAEEFYAELQEISKWQQFFYSARILASSLALRRALRDSSARERRDKRDPSGLQRRVRAW